jgi:putative hemolysin
MTVALILFLLFTASRMFFEMARSALVHLHRPKLNEMVESGNHSAIAVRALAENATRLEATAQVGTTLSMAFAAGIAAFNFVPWLQRALVSWGLDATSPMMLIIAYLAVMLSASFVLFVFGRLLPEGIAIQHAETVALASVRPMQVFSWLFAPLAKIAVGITNAIALLFGVRPRSNTSMFTQEEIRTMVDASEEEGQIEEEEKAMIYSVLDLSDTIAREVMVPRIDMIALDSDSSLEQALDLCITSAHSRIPVYRKTVDDIIGVLYAKDLLRAMREKRAVPIHLEQILRAAYFVPESKKVSELLQELQKRRVHLCIAVDEFGGTAGIVTIEDILEEIVGDIQDEFDIEEPEHVALPEQSGYLLDGGMSLDDVNELLGTEMQTDLSDTLGGFIYDQLGEVPEVGAKVAVGEITFEVTQVSDRRIIKVKAEGSPLKARIEKQEAQDEAEKLEAEASN